MLVTGIVTRTTGNASVSATVSASGVRGCFSQCFSQYYSQCFSQCFSQCYSQRDIQPWASPQDRRRAATKVEDPEYEFGVKQTGGKSGDEISFL